MFRPLASRPPKNGDLIDQAVDVADLLRVARLIGAMPDVAESHRLGDEVLQKLVRVLVAKFLSRHPDAKAALEIVRLDLKRDKWFTAK